MVYRNKDVNNPPTLLNVGVCLTCKNDLNKNHRLHEAKSSCYRNATLPALRILYQDKCSACERERRIELQVDHYRPHKPRNFKTNIQYNHLGYYWLMYEWFNLIPLCSYCNQKKSNKFPIIGIRIDDLTNPRAINPFNPNQRSWIDLIEQPLILNPEIERHPELHFFFNKSCKMLGKTPHGKETILVYDLNRRDLNLERLKSKNTILDMITEAFDEYLSNRNVQELKGSLNIVFSRLIIGSKPNREFSMMKTFFIKYFDYYIASNYNKIVRNKLNDYFDEYKRKKNII